jgi:TrmH family RNA methyltransferase
MGALFSVPLARVRKIAELPGRRVGLVPRDGRPLAELEGGELTLVVGAEREGLPGAVLAQCDEVCHIPIRSESLNAAMAATVAMYEVSR